MHCHTGNRISKATFNAIEELLQKNRALAMEKAEQEQAAANQTGTHPVAHPVDPIDDVVDGGDADVSTKKTNSSVLLVLAVSAGIYG